ncbi:MAG: HNH endonuclease [Acidiferrobacter sp.]
MQSVTTMKQVLANIAELERGRTANSMEYLGLITRGTCFVPYSSDVGIAFAPSRFIGYVGNKLSSHTSNPDRDGRVTNAALTRIIESPPLPDAALEKRYIAFCRQIGVSASKAGAFGNKRKYWIPPDIADLLDTEALVSIANNPKLSATDRMQLAKARLGQGRFRDGLLDYWTRCCVTLCPLHMVLRASHIKPWSKSSNRERLDMFNGLLLSPNADVLFDKGLISFKDSGEMLISPQVSHETLQALIGKTEVKIDVTARHAKYLAYHRKHRFRAAAA